MTTDHPGTPRVKVFGDLRLTRGGIEVDLGSPRQQLLFAELLAARGRPVGAEHLIESLWGEEPPASAMNQIHRYVGDLRRAFEPELKAREVGSYVVPTPSGYRLLAGTVSSDLADFYVEANEAKQKAADGAPSATAAYRRLLVAVADRAFEDLPFGAASRPQFAEVERDRVNAAVAAADHALATDGADELAHLIEGIAATSPADERLQARTLRLLAAQGRTAQALALFERTRHRLADDFGISPGAELSSAFSTLLEEDSRAAASTPAEAVAVDTLLPRSVSFLARVEQESLLDEAREAAIQGGSALVIISGMAGIGKTTLATNWAHRVKADFRGGCISLDLRGFTPDAAPVETASAVDSLLVSLGVDVPSAGSSPAQRRDRYQSMLSRGGYLLLLDNVRDADQIRALLPISYGSMVIVTSRDTLTGLVMHEGATQILLGRLSDSQARELLGRRLGSRGASEPRAMDAMTELCAGLPLALTIVAARANLQRGTLLSELAAELGSARGRLAELRLDSADSDVRAAFEWSHRLLSAPAARLFSRLSVHPGPQLSLLAVAGIGSSTLSEVQAPLDELLAANMLFRSSAGSFEMHDLLRRFAQEKLQAHELAAAQTGLLQYLLVSMRAVFIAATGVEPAFGLPWTGSVAAEYFSTDADAVDWYRREQTALSTALVMCRERQLDAEFASIVLDARPVRGLLSGNTSWGLASQQEVLRAARRANSASMEAEAHRDLSFALLQAGDRVGYQSSMNMAIALFRTDHNAAGEGFVLRGQVAAAIALGDVDGVRELADRFVNFARMSGREALLVDALSISASAAVNLKDWAAAIEATDEALRLAPAAFKIQNLTLSANRAISLNMVGRSREAYELIKDARAPVEQDTIASWGWISEMVVCSANLKDVAATRSALQRYDQFLVRFDEQIRSNYPEAEYLWITERIESSARAIGLSRTDADATSTA